ncbi:MAG TPA: T9SS type A sorting domain-containing protein [Saprospiraceae bacterium]|nr:T9SS type A sorting domain-containing protein [Saprospiraceae bacterium]HND88529.1 T9SS type A sorting domain-containing protein [Saprospiraceae bacterium]HNG88877.1 T9SS type A sorting domain-containing protein [Saprospiraceae bacterium]
MKKTFPLMCALLLSALAAQAQQCMRDSSLLLKPDTVIISPLPYTQQRPIYGLWAACIGQPYTQSVTIKIPPVYNSPFGPITLTNASLSTSGAVTGLPTGLTYKCDPPNCIFNAQTLGCILLYGTPSNPAEAPDTVELKIKAKVSGSLSGVPLTLDISFPDPLLAPGNYYLMVREANNCSSAAYDLGSPITSVKNTPNPFGDYTLLELESAIDGQFRFEVFNLMGQRVHDQQVQVFAGTNQLTFDANDLPNGSYYYSFSHPSGKVSKMLAIQR